jgi:glycyl-tRNA synthetase beta subunit
MKKEDMKIIIWNAAKVNMLKLFDSYLDQYAQSVARTANLCQFFQLFPDVNDYILLKTKGTRQGDIEDIIAEYGQKQDEVMRKVEKLQDKLSEKTDEK